MAISVLRRFPAGQELAWDPVFAVLSAEPQRLQVTVSGTLASGASDLIGSGAAELPAALRSAGRRAELSVALEKEGRHQGEVELLVES